MMSGNRPLVSVIVLNWNKKDYLPRCLDSVFRQDYPNLEVLFVDNGSDDGSVTFVREHYPDARVIPLGHNMGFAPANNIGIQEASGTYVMSLNNDTELDERCIGELVRVIEQHPNAWSCSPKIVSFELPATIVNVGIESRNFNPGDRGHGDPDDGRYDQIEEIFGPNGGAGLYRQEVLDEIGGFDEDFVAYYEDVDLAWRARLAGWCSIYAPEAICRHAFGGTNKSRTFYIEYHIFRNIIWLYIKDLPYKYLLEKLPTLLKQEVVFWISHLRRWDIKWLRMKIHTYQKLPKMFKKRRVIQKNRRLDDQEFERWYRPVPPSSSPDRSPADLRPSSSSSSTGMDVTTP